MIGTMHSPPKKLPPSSLHSIHFHDSPPSSIAVAPLEVVHPQATHSETQSSSNALVRDIIIGISDGLTVPFALATGLSGSSASSSIVVTAGLAEVAAGAIAMGLGGYSAAKSDTGHYNREEQRETNEIVDVPEKRRKK